MQAKQKIILHCDVNNFFASVECALNPSIKNLAVAVTGEKSKRNGIVIAKNNVAKSFGVATGDTVDQAKKKCPDLICVRPHHDVYLQFSNNIKRIYLEYTDKVESFGIDECWLDITDTVKFFKSAKNVADTLRQRIKDEIGVTISVGISFSKTFAKLGSDLKKPDAVTEISKQNYKTVVWPLPIDSIIGIGRKTKQKLEKIGIVTLHDLATFDKTLLQKRLGIVGVYLHNKVNGIGDDDVCTIGEEQEVKSIGNGTTTIVDIKNINDMKSVALFLADEIATRLRKKGFSTLTISASVRFADLTWARKSKTILKATNNAKEIYDTALEIINKIWNGYSLVRSIRICASSLCLTTNSQINFFENNHGKENLDKAIDKIREKYGYSSIRPLITQNPNLINMSALRLDEEEDFLYDD